VGGTCIVDNAAYAVEWDAKAVYPNDGSNLAALLRDRQPTEGVYKSSAAAQPQLLATMPQLSRLSTFGRATAAARQRSHEHDEIMQVIIKMRFNTNWIVERGAHLAKDILDKAMSKRNARIATEEDELIRSLTTGEEGGGEGALTLDFMNATSVAAAIAMPKRVLLTPGV
jgi:hypothetical protein